MRGNKFLLKISSIIAVLVLGVASSFLFRKNINSVQAEDTSLFNRSYVSQEYDDGVMFAVEQVYFNKAEQSNELYYDNAGQKKLSNILGYDGNNYFANLNSDFNPSDFVSSNDTKGKKIIYPGDFAMIDDVTPMTVYKKEASGYSSVSLNQGIMMSLGGYIYEDNKMWTNEDSSKMSKLTYVGITIYRDGVKITDTADSGSISLRTYNSGLYFDFVYFLEASKANEGYYQIELSYTLEGNSNLSHNFDFYMLLTTSYTSPQEVNGHSYTSYPTFENTNKSGEKHYQMLNNAQMPVLTYDYKHYDLEYAYKVNDLVTKVDVKYEREIDQGINRLNFTSTVNGVSSTKNYDLTTSNSIVSLVFANIGTYQFQFKYVYNYNGNRLVVDNLTIPSMELNIHGYEIKYAKNGFSSSTFRKLTIAENGVVVVPVAGFNEAEVLSLKDIDLGYIYELNNNTTLKSGTIITKESPNTTVEYDVVNNKFDELPTFVNTDQGGVWLELNDKYDLTNSFYLYSYTPFKTETDYKSNKINFQKDTTFTKLGYYYVCVNYTCDSTKDKQTQHFAFRISSSTANVSLRTTTAENINDKLSSDGRIYSNQFTNKNVYAEWDNPGTFESQQIAYLYYSNKNSNPYQSKEALLNYARGGSNSAITKELFDKDNRLIKDSGSYLLEMQVVGSQTRVYYYFVVDKEDISGIETLGVSSAFVGNNIVYSVATDESGNPVKYTSNFVIDKSFTMWWNDKPSGAKITGSYKFAPIVYNKQTDEMQIITIDGVQYRYLKTNYKLGTVSYSMSIEKPASQYAVVGADNVLTKQGIYWFNLVDEAGNQMNYMVVVDNTEAKINATTKSGVTLASGSTSSEDVTLEWGTHKIITLNIEKNGTNINSLYAKFGYSETDKYFKADTSNYDKIAQVLVDDGANVNFAIKFDRAVVDSMGNTLTLNNDGTYTLTGNSWSADRYEISNGYSIVLKPVMREWAYTLKVFGENQKYSQDSTSFFSLILNKDKSEGKIKSKENESDDFNTKVSAYNDEYSEINLKKNYLDGQASDDGIFVFEWLSGVGTETEVKEVYYEYYPLMTQEELNRYDKNDPDFEFYPYSKTSTKHYIFGGDSYAQNYNIVEIDGKTFYRSHYINVGYVSYYENNTIISKNATKPGMYIVTRTYKTEVADDAKTRSYVFFVDRNKIIDYSTTGNSSTKTVGNYIDFLMQDILTFDSFTEKTAETTFKSDTYSIYLQSNKLPLSIRIPNGKYASQVANKIVRTSNSNSGGLKFNIIYIDTQNYLGNGNNAGFTLFKMTDMQKQGEYYVTDGYITYLLNTNSLYVADNNGGNINRYLKACNKLGTEYLSLPGIYIIEILDNVGKTAKANNLYEMEDCNKLTIGIEITQNLPSVEAFAGKNADGVTTGTDRIETVLTDKNTTFSTNKTFAMYELPAVNSTDKNAQIDDGYIYITRKDIDTGKEEVYYNSANNTGVVNTSTLLDGSTRNVIDKSVNGKTIVWLDTGIKFDGNKVTEYKEYVYTIKIRYILYKGDVGYYTYNYVSPANANEILSIASYYESTFDINIDRTPILTNIQNAINSNGVLPSQKDFLREYVQAILQQSGADDYIETGKLYNGTDKELVFNTTAYRDNNGEVNFALTNKAYYYLLEKGKANADNANYAIRVHQNLAVDMSQASMYVRKIENNNLATLLPVTQKYNETGYNKFDKNELSGGFVLVNSVGGATWANILTDEGLYEIVELDDCGNYTQYIVLYCSDTDASKYNSTLAFEDVLFENEARIKYDLALTFAEIKGQNLEFKPNLTISKNGESVSINSFALTGLWSVVDTFGNSWSNGETSNGSRNAKDAYQKIVLKSQSAEKVFYSNYQDFNIARFLFENIQDNQNYVITITDRFNNSLSFDLNINENIYNMDLNVDNFVVEKEVVGATTQYVLTPNRLNSKDTVTNFTFYAKEIKLFDDTNKQTVIYTLNSNGEILSFVENGTTYTYNGSVFVPDDDKKQNKELPNTKIVLITGHYYTAVVTDMVNKAYNIDNLFAGDSSFASVNFDFASPHTDYNNEYYTTGKVSVGYDTNAFDSVRVRIYQDGTPIEDRVLEDSGLGDYISASTEVANRKTFTLLPYKNSNLIAKTGASLQYVISFLNSGVKKKESTIYIDNRVPTLSIVSEKGEDKANIVRVDYEYFDQTALETDKFKAENMFRYTPTLSLSETVKLSWDDVNNCNYVVNNFTYFSTKLYLYTYDSKDDWTRKELTTTEDMYMWLSPKENSIGRYVFVYAICNNDGKCMMFKAFSFNISSTANAMYEVQDENGNVVEYNGTIKGETLKGIVANWIGLKTSFEFVDVLGENPSSQDQERHTRYTKFNNQILPVYVSNSVLNVVPNGDNGVTSRLYTEDLTDYYTLNLYQVYNQVHTTYVVILSVKPTSSLAKFTASAEPIRYVTTNSTMALNSSVATVDELGKMFFPSFFKGDITSTSKAEALLKINQLYLDVYYKLSETDKKHVGKIFGDYAIDDDGVVIQDTKFVEFKSSGAYQIYLCDIAGNIHSWGSGTVGENADSLTLNVVNEVLVSVNGNAPIDYAYYNGDVTVAVSFNNLYENASTTIKAYRNGAQNEYITTDGGRKTNYLSSFTFTEYGTYKVVVSAKRKNMGEITKVIVFSIINGDEARLALDFTSISKYDIKKVTNSTTGSDVSDIFKFLLNEGFIYSKLITYDRLSAENAFGSTMGKQSFQVEYSVSNDPLLPTRNQSFKFTINNQTPSLRCSLAPGESTTKEITLTLNPQTIYRQVGDCYVMVNDQVVLSINEQNSQDRTMNLTLSDVGVYYVRIMSDSGRVISSFQVTIKEPLNTWSIVLIVAVAVLVIGVITVFIILRTKMRVR